MMLNYRMSYKQEIIIIIIIAIIIPEYFLLRLVPESPRWLVTRGKVAEAKVILSKMAKANGARFPERVFEEMVEEVQEEERQREYMESSGARGSETLVNMVRHRPLAIRLAIVLWNW